MRFFFKSKIFLSGLLKIVRKNNLAIWMINPRAMLLDISVKAVLDKEINKQINWGLDHCTKI